LPAICTDLLRSSDLGKCSTYLRVRLRYSEALEHQDLGTSHPAEPLCSRTSKRSHQTDPQSPQSELLESITTGASSSPVRREVVISGTDVRSYTLCYRWKA
jgi:hypothetical protein